MLDGGVKNTKTHLFLEWGPFIILFSSQSLKLRKQKIMDKGHHKEKDSFRIFVPFYSQWIFFSSHQSHQKKKIPNHESGVHRTQILHEKNLFQWELLKTTELGKDLGVIIKTELKFSKHIKIQVIKANRMMKLIHRSYEYTDGETLVKPQVWWCKLMSVNMYMVLTLQIWNLSDSKSFQVYQTLISILIDLNNAVVWMVLILPLISNSSNLFSKPLGTVLSASLTICTTITFNFHSFLSSLARSKYLSLFSLWGPLRWQSP